ncbi:hypothetical protein HS125_19795 [bacterium]|nr:hypothetical protein [bacterium]
MSSLPEGRRDIATGELITPERASAPPAPRGGGCARGCLIAFIVLLILVVVAAILISVYWRKLTTSVVRPLITQAVDALPLPADEVAEAKVVAGDLLDAWKARGGSR